MQLPASAVQAVAFGAQVPATQLPVQQSVAAVQARPDTEHPVPNGQELFITERRQVTQNAGGFAINLSLLTSARTATDARARVLVLTDSL